MSGGKSGRGIEEIRAELAESARGLLDLQDLDDATRNGMRSLIAELTDLLDQGGTAEEIEPVSELSARFRGLLDEASDQENLVSRAREMLEQAAAHAEADAPILTNVVRRLLDVLAEIGI